MDRRYNNPGFSLFIGKRIASATLSVFLSAICLLPSGCSSSSDPEPEPEAKELKTSKDQTSTDTPEAELVQLSKKMYQVGMYSVARDSLASLKDRYPLGAYAKFAEIKYADSYFFNREYNEAAKAYENVIKSYPGSPDLPYIKLQAARSHIASARDAGRDRQPWERGLTIYNEIIAAYPETAYSDLAKTERGKVIEELSAYDREIIEFYRRQNNQAAVDVREARFKERWGVLLSEISSPQGAEPGRSEDPLLKDLTLAQPMQALESGMSETVAAQ
jgi:outer membrane assembly lipoprotein YfiO